MPNFCPKIPDFRAIYRAERHRMHWHRARRAAGAAVAAGFALLVLNVDLQVPSTAEPPDAGVVIHEEHPGFGLTDAAEFDRLQPMAALQIPDSPPAWQKTTCSKDRGEVSIKGGCYSELARKPPCLQGQFEYKGSCWLAVGKAERPTHSIGQ